MKHTTFMRIAEAVAGESKCISKKVGAVLVKGNDVISTGYNGTAEGDINCSDGFERGLFTREEHSMWSQKFEIHSEMSCLLRCKLPKKGSRMYVTHSPCFNCMKHIKASGVTTVYFGIWYDRMTSEERDEVIEYCWRNEIQLYQVVGDGLLTYA